MTTDWLNEERQELAVDRILEAARGVFARDGISGTRMGKIAEAAGCSRATLYRYFPNKEALLHAYMARVAKDFGEVLDEKLRGLRSLADRLVEAVAVSVLWKDGQVTAGCSNTTSERIALLVLALDEQQRRAFRYGPISK